MTSSVGEGAPPVGLYVHVPFCVSHCPYCDFVVVAGREARGPANRIEKFVEALTVELGLRAGALDTRWGPPGTRPPLDTLYLGGGTPSLLPAGKIAELIDLVRSRFGLEPGAEVTLEVNPGREERGDATALLSAGATRWSIGAQSFDQGELRALGRRHTPADVVDAVREARAAGARSVSLDLLYDVPGQTIASWVATLDAAIALEPDHLSVYALTLDDPDGEGLTGPNGDHLPLRPGARRWRDRARQRQDDDRAAAMYEVADARLAGSGFDWYEISNWSRPGHESRHNLAYWRRVPYEAAGPGAHAFDAVTRRWNAGRLDGYLAALLPPEGGRPKLPPGGRERVVGSDALAESAILALRTRDGLRAASGDQSTGEWPDGRLRQPIEAGLVEQIDGAFVLTTRGRLLSNEVFATLLPGPAG